MTEPEVKKKKRVNGKAKGSGFERSVANMMSIALAPMNFKRTQQSGAIVGGLNSKHIASYSAESLSLFVGDLSPINESDVFRDEGWKFRFTLECKFYKTPPNLEHLFSNDQIRLWYEESATDALKINKEPLLIFKYNHTDIFCASRQEVVLPITVTKALTFSEPGGRKTLVVFKLKEAILDLDWWKETHFKDIV